MLNAEAFKGKKVLISGVTSFTGSWLSTWLQMMGSEVFGFSKNSPAEGSMFRATGLQSTISFRELDILNAEGIKQLLNDIKPDLVFHLAGQSLIREAVHTPVNTLSTNILGTIYLLEGLRNVSHPCTAIFVSSDKSYRVKEEGGVYSEDDFIGGEDPYSASKSSMEIITRAYYKTYFSSTASNIRLGIARASNMIGGGDWSKDRILPDCIRAWQSGEALHIQSPFTIKPWQHILDPLSGYLLYAQDLLHSDTLNGETFNFGTLPENIVDVQTLISGLASCWKGHLPADPYRILPSERQVKSSLIRLNWEKANSMLGWRPQLDIQKTLSLTADWYGGFIVDPRQAGEITRKQIREYSSFN